MNVNDENLFDELVRQKLEGYSEVPDMQLMQNIHSKKGRVLKLYGLYRLLIITSAIGLGLFGAWYHGSNSQTASVKDAGVIAPAAQKQDASRPESGALVSTKAHQANNKGLFSNQNKEDFGSYTISNREGSTGKAQQQQDLQSKKTGRNTSATAEKQHDQKGSVTNKPGAVGKNVPVPAHKISAESSSVNKGSEKPQEIKKEENKSGKGEEPEKGKEEKKDEVSCMAAFEYSVSYNGEVSFVNFSSAENHISNEWQFGDGGRSLHESPDHLYMKEGEYIVSLTVTDTKTGCKNTVQKQVVTGNAKEQKQPTRIMGIVRAGSTLLSGVRVEAIREVDGTEPNEVYIARANRNGEYVFDNMRPGRYWLAAYPADPGSGYVKTFWGTETEILSAPQLVVTGDHDGDLKGYGIDLIYMGLNADNKDASTGAPGNDTVLLVDNNNNVVGRAIIDGSGKVNYEGSASGTYKMVNPKTGEPKGEISVSPGFSGAARSASPSDKATSGEQAKVALSPNPAHDMVNIALISEKGSQSTIIVLNSNGAELMRSQKVFEPGSNSIPVDVSQLSPGVYYIMVVMSNGQVLTSRLMKDVGTGSKGSEK